VEAGKAAGEDLDEITDDRAFGRGDNAYAGGEARELALARGFEEAVGEEFLFEVFEGELECAVALGFDGFDDELVFAAEFVDVDTAADEDLDAVFGFEFQAPVRELPADTLDLGGFVLQCEVVVSASGQLRAGDLARNPDVGKLSGEHIPHLTRQLADRVAAAFSSSPIERDLFHPSSVAEGKSHKRTVRAELKRK